MEIANHPRLRPGILSVFRLMMVCGQLLAVAQGAATVLSLSGSTKAPGARARACVCVCVCVRARVCVRESAALSLPFISFNNADESPW